MNNNVGFCKCLQSQYNGLTSIDEDTIYIVTDTGRIYKGSVLVGTSETGGGSSTTGTGLLAYNSFDKFISDFNSNSYVNSVDIGDSTVCTYNKYTSTLQLWKDVSLSQTITITKPLKFDLNGYSVVLTGTAGITYSGQGQLCIYSSISRSEIVASSNLDISGFSYCFTLTDGSLYLKNINLKPYNCIFPLGIQDLDSSHSLKFEEVNIEYSSSNNYFSDISNLSKNLFKFKLEFYRVKFSVVWSSGASGFSRGYFLHHCGEIVIEDTDFIFKSSSSLSEKTLNCLDLYSSHCRIKNSKIDCQGLSISPKSSYGLDIFVGFPSTSLEIEGLSLIGPQGKEGNSSIEAPKITILDSSFDCNLDVWSEGDSGEVEINNTVLNDITFNPEGSLQLQINSSTIGGSLNLNPPNNASQSIACLITQSRLLKGVSKGRYTLGKVYLTIKGTTVSNYSTSLFNGDLEFTEDSEVTSEGYQSNYLSGFMNVVFPINTIIPFYDNADHSKYLGFTWERCLVGRVPVGIDSNDTDFNTISKQVGKKSHKLTVDEMPSHSHNFRLGGTATGSRLAVGWHSLTIDTDNYNDNNAIKTSGGDQPHNNIQPSEVVAFWKRIS